MVQWRYHKSLKATWELEAELNEKYPYFFEDRIPGTEWAKEASIEVKSSSSSSSRFVVESLWGSLMILLFSVMMVAEAVSLDASWSVSSRHLPYLLSLTHLTGFRSSTYFDD
ncbi:hypothetical protein OSB04_028235 [Centaurea solstitialis]|uniref:Uncharacterized protein n=1 Tax=Centaurea solstitialis TaxID=347529 RepID=A0AA38W916_9ASTR|nr:hypothetical protein OSB04_028235 [Centaurea solstitialis]